uniref:Mitogen-activated protein kinase kinase kinase n=1 Tax=Plectus sambesii TaxID=2011161 RepID=A0A914XTF2_9BILA
MMETVYVIAKFDYAAKEEKELSIKKNELLKLVDDSTNWWQVKNEHNQSGSVPRNCLRKEFPSEKRLREREAISKQDTGNSKPKLPNSNAEPSLSKNSMDLSPFSSTIVDHISPRSTSLNEGIISTAIVKYAYKPRLEDELRVKVGDIIAVLEKSEDGWWKGRLNEEIGWFPSNFVDEKPQITSTPRFETNESSSAVPVMEQTSHSSQIFSNERILEVVIGLFTFEARIAEELSFQKDERLDIIDHPPHDPDWWKARNAEGSVGLIPINYIKVLERPAPSDSPSSGFASGSNSRKTSFILPPPSEPASLLIEESVTLLSLGATEGGVLARCNQRKDPSAALRTSSLRIKNTISVRKSLATWLQETSAQEQKENKRWSPNNYVKKERLGQGAFGVVYKCFDTDAQKIFVAKETILHRQDIINMAGNEISRLKDMNHPRIIDYYGFKMEESTIVIFMEYMAAGSLRQILQNFGLIKEPASIKYIDQMLDGLAYIHKIGIVHCDLKCDNILSDGQGNVKLGDFGIAVQKLINTANHSYFSQEVKGGGTYHWLAPEVISGQGCSRRSDIWSLGCTIVEMLTGEPPHGKMPSPMFMGAMYNKSLSYHPDDLAPSSSDKMKAFLSQLLQFEIVKRPYSAAEAITIFKNSF